MEQIKSFTAKLKFCFVTGMMAGIIMGSTAISMIVSYRVDLYHKNIAYLETTIEDKNARLEKLEATINTKELILKDIEVLLEFDGDEMDKIIIEKNINDKYNTLLGKEVKNIDADIVIEVVDNRIFMIEDREYQLHVNKLVLTEVLKIWIMVHPLNEGN
ncbi:hypothetical protein I5677_16865 [Mobilitalea sibirica]|uniref:Sporulation membrane protein YtrI C-terminal domain-containing protein n=1 Tax=Mobilitalea sibirica TaxID=1462919 RepID=A0A8J7HCZ1_9FIRM|nr:hypothetical protein [Mobilitalea sibirica]MBH1942566.1 hypothetical protein [Mobilitalea sibirica]